MYNFIPTILGFQKKKNKEYITDKGIDFILEVLGSIAYFIPFIIYTFFKNSSFLKSSWYPETIDEVKEFIAKEKKTDAYISFIQGFILIIIAIKKFYFYKASPDEISLGILLKYLRRKQILEEDVYEVIRKYKPLNIEKYIDKKY